MDLATEPAVIGGVRKMAGSLSLEVLERIGIPRRHWNCTLSSIPDNCPHKQVIVNWIADIKSNIRPARGLLLMGEYSQGKSGLCSIMLKAAMIECGILGYWVRARDLPKHLIEKTVFDDELTVMQRAESVPLLVIDELQIRDDIAYTEQAVEMLVRRRIDDELCTILTTNHKVSELKIKYPALAAALVEVVKPIVVSGHNFREDRAKQWQ